MKRFLDSHIVISIQLLVIAAVIAAAAYTVHASKKSTYELVAERAESQVRLLEELFATTDRNGADDAISSVISDCPHRTEFDSLLGSLGTLGSKELVKTQQLLESCGGYFAERKALMVVRIEREIEYLEDMIELLKSLEAPYNTQSLHLAEWKLLHEQEVKRSSLLKEQVSLQESIITALLIGTAESRATIADYGKRAQSIGETLMVLDQQIDEQRKQLVKVES